MEMWKKLGKKDWIVNSVLYLIGIAGMPLGVVMTIRSHLGAGGYDALNFALGDRLGVQTSTAIYMTAVIALVLAAVIRRKMLRITTFVSSFFLGIFTDIWKKALAGLEGTDLLSSWGLFLVGILVIAFAVAAYVLCVFPANPTDDLA